MIQWSCSLLTQHIWGRVGITVQVSKRSLGQDALISTYTGEGQVSNFVSTAIPLGVTPGT